MLTYRVASMFLLMLIAQPAWAFFDPPYLTPVNPTAHEMVYVNIYGGECDLIDGGLAWPPPVTQEGNAITILFTGSHDTNPEFCYHDVGTATFPVGSFPAGTYTLEVIWRYPGFGGGSFDQQTLGIIPFVVVGDVPPPTTAAPAPTLGAGGIGILLLMLTGIAIWASYSRQS